MSGRSTWPRLLLVELLQLPAVLLVILGHGPGAWWCAGLWSSLVLISGTDSDWRWRNRLLVGQAAAWLLAASLLGSLAR